MLVPGHVRRQKQKQRSRRWRRDRGLGKKIEESGAKESRCCEECTDTTCRSKLMDIEEEAPSDKSLSDTSSRKENTKIAPLYDSDDEIVPSAFSGSGCYTDEPDGKIAPSYDEKSQRLDDVSSEVSDDMDSSSSSSIHDKRGDVGTEHFMKRGDVYVLPNFVEAREDSPPAIFRAVENKKLVEDCVDILSGCAPPLEKRMRSLEVSPLKYRKSLNSVLFNDRMHTLTHIPPNECKPYPQQRCVGCRKRGIRKDTRYFCEDCPMKPAFCKSCFNSTHM